MSRPLRLSQGGSDRLRPSVPVRAFLEWAAVLGLLILMSVAMGDSGGDTTRLVVRLAPWAWVGAGGYVLISFTGVDVSTVAGESSS
jgi:hypothetical protein